MEEMGVYVSDFSMMEEMDPSLSDGYRVLYDREVPLEICHQHNNESVRNGTVETLKIKLLILGPEESPSSVKVELSSEADLFFHYMHCIEETGYKKIQEHQKLMVEFSDYPSILMRMLNASIREPHIYNGVFTMYTENDARLDFIQNMEYKFVELMSCSFSRSSDEVVQNQITYRYNSMKQRMTVMQTRLMDINTLVKTKNPSLLLQLQKSTLSSPLVAVGINSVSRR
jgi:hypothetical protein